MKPAPMLLSLALLIGAADASAQGAPAGLPEALVAGTVGERFDGYLGFAEDAEPQLRKQVAAANIRRRALYTELAGRKNLSPQVAGYAAACQLFARIAVGQSYQLADGRWRRRGAQEPAPRPGHCG